MNPPLSFLDAIIFISVFAITLSAVAYGRKKLAQNHLKEDRFELLLMGRKITLPLFIASLVASWYGEITGVTAFTFENGLFSFLTQSMVWYAVYIIFALVIIPKIPNSPHSLKDASTFPELVGNHLGKRAHRITAILNILSLLPIASILSAGIFIHYLTDWPLFTSSAIGLLCIFTYSLSGGLRSVVFADVIQFVAMMTAVILVAVFAMIHHGPPTVLPTLLPETHLKLMGGHSISDAFIWGFIALVTLVDPLFYQRTLAAKNKKQAMQGILGATVVWFIFDCAAVTGALYARAFMPHAQPNDSYFNFSMSVLPNGIRGLFLAGVFAAIVSSLDSHLFSASSIFAFDVLKKENFNKRRLQISMLGTGMIALFITPLFHGNVAQVWKVMGSLSSSCLLFPWLLMMLFPKTKSESCFIASVAVGLVMMTVGGALTFYQRTTIDPFYFGLLGSFFGFILNNVWRKNQKA